MRAANKVKLANLTTWIMISTITLILLFFVGFITINAFKLNIFTERATELIAGFVGLSFLAVTCSAILNISLNISLIADSQIRNLKDSVNLAISKKFYLYGFAIVSLLVSFLFVGDYLTRQQGKAKLIAQASDIIEKYQSSIDKISNGLNDNSKIGEIPATLNFLSQQRQGYGRTTVITGDNYDGQLTFLEISSSDKPEDLTQPYFGNSFYQCSEHDCQYLENFFSGKTDKPFFWTEKDDYNFYRPFVKDGKRFILLFSKYQRYGKFGSS